MHVCIVTVGCPKNTADSDFLSTALRTTGLDLVDDAGQAETIIINTCGFIAPACEESLDTILEIAQLKTEGRCRHLLVCGCMVERYRDELMRELPEVDAFFGLAEKHAPEIARAVAGWAGRRHLAAPAPGRRSTPATSYAYVKISDGCDRSCSFCTIPSIRGAYRSRAADEIAAEIGGLVEAGIREVVLVGQETTTWGRDLEGRPALSKLLERLAPAHPDTWIRLMYLQPDGVDDDLIDVVAGHDNVCNYFDVPFQHASAPVLRRMRRGGAGDRFLAVVDRIRARTPDAALRTSLIVGFPGESDDDFAQLSDFVRAARLDYAGIFTYSPEEGTEAATLPDAVDPDTSAERHRMLAELADEISAARIAARVGTELDVLVETVSLEQEISHEGRSQLQAPEVDGLCLLGWEAPAGQLVRARVEETDGYDMICGRL